MKTIPLALPLIATLAALGCASTRPPAGASLDALTEQANDTVALFQERDPSMDRFFERSYGWAVFPKVTKGAAGIGAANGRGLVIEDGDIVGYSTVTQATIGFQLGGQTYREIVFFQTRPDLEHFKAGRFEFDAQASAVAARAGASADANYARGAAVFTMTRAGLMYEASIGGQKFTYEPLHEE